MSGKRCSNDDQILIAVSDEENIEEPNMLDRTKQTFGVM